MIDVERMQKQEFKDYLTTKRIFEQIFSAYDAEVCMVKEADYSHIDARLTVTKNGKSKQYTVEIKTRNVDSPEYLETMPLKVSKYCDIMDVTYSHETPLVIYLINDEDYYIFNLKKLDWNNIKCFNWCINKVEYTTNKKTAKTPVFMLPISEAIYNGLIPKKNANNQ